MPERQQRDADNFVRAEHAVAAAPCRSPDTGAGEFGESRLPLFFTYHPRRQGLTAGRRRGFLV